VSGLATAGKLIVSVHADPIQLNALSLLFGGRRYTKPHRHPIDSEDTLPSGLSEYPPEDRGRASRTGADAYRRMMQGKARCRIVLVTKDGFAQIPPNEA